MSSVRPHRPIRSCGVCADTPDALRPSTTRSRACSRPNSRATTTAGMTRRNAFASTLRPACKGARAPRAHGPPAAARALVQEALDSLPVLPASSKFGDPALWRMQALREAGHDREALTLAESLSVRQPVDVALTAIVGA